MNKRKAISTRTRFEVFKRDDFTCQYCGGTPPNVLLHVDHIVAVAKGGENGMDNLVTACQSCNLGKSAVPLTSVPQSLKDKSAEIAEREKQLIGYNKILQGKRQRVEAETWDIATVLEHDSQQSSYPRKRLQSIKMFLDRLPFESVREAASLTAAKFYPISDRAFRYFCAVCWNKVRGH